jgi:spore coat polysaccharide biosynthesis protein SpsF
MDTEVFSYETLKKAYLNATEHAYREHVTPYIYWNPKQFMLINVANYQNLSKHRWTVDTPEDFELIKRIIESLYPTNPFFRMEDVVELLNYHQDWQNINAHIEQKKIEVKG